MPGELQTVGLAVTGGNTPHVDAIREEKKRVERKEGEEMARGDVAARCVWQC